jgi:hypothetical protein
MPLRVEMQDACGLISNDRNYPGYMLGRTSDSLFEKLQLRIRLAVAGSVHGLKS